MVELYQLKQRQGLPLKAKIVFSEKKIREFYDHFHGNVYVSFSGGKDSTVLLDLVRSIYPKVPAVFVDTGLEYPEIKKFVKSIKNVTWLRPKFSFKKVIEKYGYPVISKANSSKIRELQTRPKNGGTYRLRKTGYNMAGEFKSMQKIPKKWEYLENAPFKISERCCDILKKNPVKLYQKETNRKDICGIMASDSRLRMWDYLKYGCNTFTTNRNQSRPLSFWLEKDIWEYLRSKSIPYSKIYDMGLDRTGCMFCMFGIHMEKEPNRFQLMAKSHPKLYDYCINKLDCGKILDYIKVDYKPLNTLF